VRRKKRGGKIPARVRESMLLAMYLHNTKSTTLSLRNEAIEDVFQRRAPPAPGGTSMKADYTRVSLVRVTI